MAGYRMLSIPPSDWQLGPSGGQGHREGGGVGVGGCCHVSIVVFKDAVGVNGRCSARCGNGIGLIGGGEVTTAPKLQTFCSIQIKYLCWSGWKSRQCQGCSSVLYCNSFIVVAYFIVDCMSVCSCSTAEAPSPFTLLPAWHLIFFIFFFIILLIC